MNTEISVAENYKARPVRGFGPIDVSFLQHGAGDEQLTTCVNASHGVGLVSNQFDGEFRVVYAMIRPNEDVGVYTAYTAKDAREMAQALGEMADYIDAENAKSDEPVKPRDEEESLVETIAKAGGQVIDLGDYMEPDPNAKNQVVWQLSWWALKHGVTYDSLGFVPQFLHTDDERPAKDQIDANYQHGGGWCEANEDGHWKVVDDKLQGDPADWPYNLVALCKVGEDLVKLFDCGWCAIEHPDGSMDVARLD